MDATELRRLIVRHRHVAPLLSVLLASTNAAVTITDLDGGVILDRQGGASADGSPVERHPITVEGQPVGWVDGPRPAGAVAAVLSYACSREMDKRALAREALDRYRELNLIYDLADQIGETLEVERVAAVAVAEASRLPTGGEGFLLLHDRDDDGVLADGLLGAVFAGEGEIVNDVASDGRARDDERAFASIVAAPLRVRGRRLGVLGARSTTPLEYRASDLKVLTAIASLAAPTLDQAATHEAATRRSIPSADRGKG